MVLPTILLLMVLSLLVIAINIYLVIFLRHKVLAFIFLINCILVGNHDYYFHIRDVHSFRLVTRFKE